MSGQKRQSGEGEREIEVWLDLLCAVQFLSHTYRLGLSVSDAVGEAISDWVAEQAAPVWGDLGGSAVEIRVREADLDSLRMAMEQFLGATPPAGTPGTPTMAIVLTTAIGSWTARMAEVFNESAPWPYPTPTDGWRPSNSPTEAAGS